MLPIAAATCSGDSTCKVGGGLQAYRVPCFAGAAEVDDLDGTAPWAAQQDVLRLEIAVHNTDGRRCQEEECRQDCAKEKGGAGVVQKYTNKGMDLEHRKLRGRDGG